MRRAATLLRHCLTVVGVACLGTWTTVTVLARAANAHNAALLDRLIREGRGGGARGSDLAAGRHTAEPPAGTLLGRIDVPRVGVSTVVLEGTSDLCLEQAAGHVRGTALPGEGGNVAIAAHRDSFFRGLRRVEPGDLVTLTTPSAAREYRVDSIRVVDPSDTGVLAPGRSDELTLVTCYPFDYIGAAPHRFVVRAHACGAPHQPTADELWSTLAEAVHQVPKACRRSATRSEGGRPRPSGRARRGHVAGDSAARPNPTPAPTAKPPARVPWWKRLFHRHKGVAAPPAARH